MEAGADTLQKALQINLDLRCYGTFAEIGAGQEVVRWFFRVGGAAGTIAKSMSAYDMTVSDAIYGKADRYVSRPAAGHARPRVPAQPRPALRRARRHDGVLRVRRHRGGAQLQGRQRVPRLDGREVPGPSARRAQPDRPARADARRRGRPAAGSARHRRREPAVRRVLPAPRARAADRVAARQPDHRPHRDRHDRVLGHRVPPGRQPPDGAQARAARPERRGHVRARPARCCSPAKCCTRRRSWSSGAASARSRIVNLDMLETAPGEVRGRPRRRRPRDPAC